MTKTTKNFRIQLNDLERGIPKNHGSSPLSKATMTPINNVNKYQAHSLELNDFNKTLGLVIVRKINKTREGFNIPDE